MREKTNPLDNIKRASPCGADWSKMYGSDIKRFCSECKLNVYNISAMTQEEAENMILSSEGRLCLRLYRRTDGTVITQNCPVGFARVKKRASLVYRAALSIAGGFIAGILGLGALRALESLTEDKTKPVYTTPTDGSDRVAFTYMGGTNDSLEKIGLDILTSRL